MKKERERFLFVNTTGPIERFRKICPIREIKDVKRFV